MRTSVVALLLVAIAGVGGAGVWAANEGGEDRFCQAGAYIMGPVPGLEGYGVSLQDTDAPGPDDCDGSDRPEWYDDEPPSDAGDPGLPAPSSTVPPPGSVLDDEPILEPLVLGHDCRYRDVDGEVVATAVPNRADGMCGLPGPDGRQPGEVRTGPTRAPRPPR